VNDQNNQAARRAKKEAWLRAIYDRHLEQFRTTGDMAPIAIARSTHLAMDALLEQDRENSAGSENIQCGKGCSHCCRGPVEIRPQEAVLLVEVMQQTGITPDVARLERQGRHTVESWREQPAADQACVFLGEDQACTVYESRPDACRKLLVMSDPRHCDVAQGTTDQIDRWFSWEAEMMASAALEVYGVTLMPRALLQVLNPRAAVLDRGGSHR
jgi:Fe-S-cluster containining protein